MPAYFFSLLSRKKENHITLINPATARMPTTI